MDGVDGIDVYCMGKVIIIVSFYCYICFYNVFVLFFSIKVVVDVDWWFIEFFVVELVVFLNNS